MFDIGFPRDWSSLKKLIWLKAINGGGGAAGVWKTVTGTLLHITDALASPMQKCEVTIEPIQEGSGDPSPDNVRPITGWTGCEVSHLSLPTGYTAVDYVRVSDVIAIDCTDIIDFSSYYLGVGAEFKGVSRTQYGNVFGTYVDELTNTYRVIYNSSATDLLYNCNFRASSAKQLVVPSNAFNSVVIWYDVYTLNDTNVSVARGQDGYANTAYTFRVGGSGCVTDFRCVFICDTQTPKTVKMLLVPCTSPENVAGFYDVINNRFHTTTDTTKVQAVGTLGKPQYRWSLPISTYQGNENWNIKSVSWQTEAGTIYGARYEFVSGLMRKSRVFYELDGVTAGKKFSGTWADAPSNCIGVYIGDMPSKTTHDIDGTSNNYARAKCSHFKSSYSGVTQMSAWQYMSGSGSVSTWIFIIPLSVATTLTEANAWLVAQKTAGTPVQIAVIPNTFEEYQLTGQQIATLKGENDVWGSGNIELTYKAQA